jgi:hypothetical protein
MFSVMVIFISATFSVTFAQKVNFNASRAKVFDPEATGGGFADWIDEIGETDSTCQTKFGALLQKNVSTNTFVSADVELKGLKGVSVTKGETLGFDIRNDSPCTAGSPRFNVSYTLANGASGFSFVGGCSGETKVQNPQNLSWSRVTLDLQKQAVPAIPSGAVLKSVFLTVDEEGTYNIDNIMFRGLYADKPGNAGVEAACSF